MNIEECNQPVAKNIQRIIRNQGLKQCAVAERANLSLQAMNNILNGRRIIRPREIARLALALGVAPNELFSHSCVNTSDNRIA